MLKKAISAFLIICFTLGMSTLILAQTEQEYFLSVPVTAEEQIQILMNDPSLTKEEREFHINRLINPESSMSSIPDSILLIAGNRAIARSGELWVQHFPQQRNNWCGPATALQSLNFWNRTAASRYTQSAIAAGWGIQDRGGIDLASIIAFVNARTGSWRYINRGFVTNRSAIDTHLRHAIQGYGSTPIVRIESVAGWPYNTEGHFLNVSGIRTSSGSVTDVRLTDPYAGTPWFQPNNNHGTFWVNFDTFFRAMTSDRQNMRRPNWAS
ncbi:MAG: hypothetical protein FWF81_08160 [Defluviitaleaceae bacterium]|nr:hypothetical protein [Defluviitaleaceae bacterium]